MIKNIPVCDYCNNVNDLPHYFIRCPKVAEFWCYWFNWWENLSVIDIRDCQVIEKCILFGFPLNNGVMHVLNFCTLYAKYYIYIQRLFNNNTLDLYVCLTQLKQEKLKKIYVGKIIMKTISSNFTLSMRNYNENNAFNYVDMNICKQPVII